MEIFHMALYIWLPIKGWGCLVKRETVFLEGMGLDF
jgi:hypothetical protein